MFLIGVSYKPYYVYYQKCLKWPSNRNRNRDSFVIVIDPSLRARACRRSRGCQRSRKGKKGEKTGEKTPANLRIRSHVLWQVSFRPQNWAKSLLGQKTRGKPLVNGLPQ